MLELERPVIVQLLANVRVPRVALQPTRANILLRDDETCQYCGKRTRDLTLDQAYDAARLTALSILASLKRELGNLDRVTRWLRAVGYVHCAPGFADNAKVVNGFSDLVVELWGDAGRHARSAPGQGPSPLNVPIIVDAIVAVEPGRRAGLDG